MNSKALIRMLRRDVLRHARVAELKRLAAEAASWRDLRARTAPAPVELPEEHRKLRAMLLGRLGGPAADA